MFDLPAQRPNGPSFGGAGRRIVVTVVGVTGYGTVMVRDKYGQEFEVPSGVRPKGTGQFRQDERWIMERHGPIWMPVSMLDHPDPTPITGSKTGVHPIVLQLLATLSDLGMVEDKTTP